MIQKTAFGQGSDVPSDNGGYTDLFDATLKPFQDEAFFRKQLASENPFLRKHPELRVDIADAIKADDDQSILDTVEILDLSREVDSPVNVAPFRAIISQITLSREIDDIKIESTGLHTSSARSNAIMNLAGRHFVDTIPDGQLQLYGEASGFIGEQIRKSKVMSEAGKNWFDVKATNIDLLIGQRMLLEEYFDNMPEKDPEPVSPEQIAEDTAAIAALFAEARTKQRYGVKIGYKEQEFRSGSLVFTPPIDLVEILGDDKNLHPLMMKAGKEDSLANITDSTKTSFKKKIGYKNTRVNEGVFRVGLGIEGRETFSLQLNGELATTHTDVPLAVKAAERGSYNAYRQLQAEILAAYIDLTTPLEVSRTTKDVRAPKAETVDYRKEPGVDIVRKLLIPRIKASDAESASESGAPREVRLHGVVWHIRHLPEGFHASPEAEKLAEEAHITLADGETFVRPHQRGSKTIGEVVTHNLVTQ